MNHNVINNIKLASQIKRNLIKIRLNDKDMKIIQLLIKLNFIEFIYKPLQKTKKTYNNYYYIKINIQNTIKYKNLYTPSSLKTISYDELSKNVLSKKIMYVLSTTKGLITHNLALRFRISGIITMVLFF